MEEEDWDPSQLSFFHHAVAGSLAGLSEHVAIFPIDTLKTHVQCERCGTSSWNCAVKIFHREGLFRLWRGVSATFIGCIPAHGAYFSVYESMKVFVGANKEGHQPIRAAVCGAAAAFAHDVFMTPMDTVKQRMQLGYYNNNFHCMKTILKQEGIRAFYRSFPTTVLMNLPYGCVMVATNESVKKFFNPKTEKYSFMVSMLAGSIAGSVAAALTNPFDVIKTRLQTHNLRPCPVATSLDSNIPHFGDEPPSSSSSSSTTSNKFSSQSTKISTSGFSNSIINNMNRINIPITGQVLNESIHTNTASPKRLPSNWHTMVINVISDILREDGYRGFLRGLGPRVVVHAPSVAISWTVYESIKHALIASDS